MGLRHWGIIVTLAACGNDHRSTGSGTATAGSAIGSAGSAADAAGSAFWDVVALRSSYAVLSPASHDRVAVVAADGRIAARIPVADATAFKTASIVKDVLVWIDDAGVHAWDLTKGNERWTSKLKSTAMYVGNDHVAILHDQGTDIVAIADGATTYHRDGAAGNSVDWKDGRFVDVDASGGIEAIDETASQPRWTAKLEGHVHDPAVVVEPTRVLVFSGADVVNGNGTHTDVPGSFIELDLATGKTNAKGTIKELPVAISPGSQQTLVQTHDGSFEQVKPENAPLEVFRVDPVWRVLWKSTTWPLADEYERGNALLEEAGAVGALMLKHHFGDDQDHVLVVFDTTTGKLRYDQKLGPNGYLLMASSGCIAVLDRDGGKLSCLDETTGKPVWTRPVGGREPLAWGFSGKDGDAIFIVDGTPPALSRLDLTGKVLWQAPLPDGAHVSARDVAATIIAVPMEHQTVIVDAATGKLSTVKL